MYEREGRVKRNYFLPNQCRKKAAMGRYAFFNTGLEYKFGFGIQTSGDIKRFGGFDNNSIDNPIHVWSQEDKEYILGILKDMEKGYDILPIDFSEFENSLKGTNRVHSKLLENISKKCEDAELYYKYYLGAIIYHQLLYTRILTAEYEY
jgi:hypothetical protein